MNAEGHINDEPNFLKETGNRTPFSTPENYFNEMESAILSRIANNRSVKPVNKTQWLSIAASFLLIATVAAIVYTQLKTPADLKLSFEETVLTEVDEAVLAEVLEKKQENATTLFENEVMNNVDEQTLIESL